MPQKRTMSPHDQQEIIESELVDFEPQLCSPACSTRVEQLADYTETHLFESWLNVKLQSKTAKFALVGYTSGFDNKQAQPFAE